MKTYAGVEVQLHAFLSSAADGGEWSALRPGSQRAPVIHWFEARWAPQTVWAQRWGTEKIPAHARNRTPVVQPAA